MFVSAALKRVLIPLVSSLLLSACVAPEEPPPPVVRRAPTATTPRPNLEAAPVPNRQLRGPSDSAIRIQQ